MDKRSMARDEAKKRLDSLCKPIDGFGRLEEVLTRLAYVQETKNPHINQPAIVVAVADNGIVEAGVSQTNSSVTASVANALLRDCSSLSALRCGTRLFVINIGIKNEVIVPETVTHLRGLDELDRIKGLDELKEIVYLDVPIKKGTNNFLNEPAMSSNEAARAIDIGEGLAKGLYRLGIDLIIMGEMGIGNTTTATLMTQLCLGLGPDRLVSRGAGLSDEGLDKKRQVIKRAHKLYAKKLYADKLDIKALLSCVGGLDLALMAGLAKATKAAHMPIVLDGFVSAMGAYLGLRLAKDWDIKNYFIPSISSREEGLALILEKLGLRPILDIDMAQGEACGAALVLPVLRLMLKAYYKIPHFEENGIVAYERNMI